MEKTLSQVPDIWYDLFARVFPGLYFCFGAYLILGRDLVDLKWENCLVFILASYVIGHAQQPLAGWSAGRLFAQKIGAPIGGFAIFPKMLQASNEKAPDGFGDASISEKRHALLSRKSYGYVSREALVLAKQHAETSSMFGFRNMSV